MNYSNPFAIRTTRPIHLARPAKPTRTMHSAKPVRVIHSAQFASAPSTQKVLKPYLAETELPRTIPGDQSSPINYGQLRDRFLADESKAPGTKITMKFDQDELRRGVDDLHLDCDTKASPGEYWIRNKGKGRVEVIYLGLFDLPLNTIRKWVKASRDETIKLLADYELDQENRKQDGKSLREERLFNLFGEIAEHDNALVADLTAGLLDAAQAKDMNSKAPELFRYFRDLAEEFELDTEHAAIDPANLTTASGYHWTGTELQEPNPQRVRELMNGAENTSNALVIAKGDLPGGIETWNTLESFRQTDLRLDAVEFRDDGTDYYYVTFANPQ